jgi:hypothetical protein
VTEHLYGAPVAAIDMSLTRTERARIRVAWVDDGILPLGRLTVPTSMGDLVVSMRPEQFAAFAMAVADCAQELSAEMGPEYHDEPVTRRVVA